MIRPIGLPSVFRSPWHNGLMEELTVRAQIISPAIARRDLLHDRRALLSCQPEGMNAKGFERVTFVYESAT